MEPSLYQQLLFPYAYNILGSVEDARDVVQEVLAKHFAAPPDTTVANQANYLIKSAINLAITIKNRQQRTLRQQEVWLPEPVATDEAADRNLHLHEVLSYSLMVLMERLNAAERAVFILRESFDYSHEEIAAVLSVTEDYSRKLLSRAKTKLFKPAPKRSSGRGAHERDILEKFMNAIMQRDTEELESIMAADILFYADGGGKVPIAASICAGAPAVAALQIMVFHKFLCKAEMRYSIMNHQPALLWYIHSRLRACQVFDIHPITGVVMQINTMLDPDKLKNLAILDV